jgi:predicted helicase
MLVKNPRGKRFTSIKYFDIGDYLSREEKLAKLSSLDDISKINWIDITPNEDGDWINQRSEIYDSFVPLAGSGKKGKETEAIFKDFTRGVQTNKDPWCYAYTKSELETKIQLLIKNYTKYLKKFASGEMSLNEITLLPKSEISWSPGMLTNLQKKKEIQFDENSIQLCNYRPFNTRWVYRHDDVVHRQCRRSIFPNNRENSVFVVTDVTSSTFSVLASNQLFDAAFLSGDGFPLKVYESVATSDQLFSTDVEQDKSAITDWALKLFKSNLKDDTVTKEDVFYYCYGVLSSPEFVQNYEQDARKSGPRVPILSAFHEWSQKGKQLFELHSNIEISKLSTTIKVEIEENNVSSNVLYKVDKIRFLRKIGKDFDKSSIRFNDFITISEIPDAAYKFKINGRSAVEWIIDQYQVHTDKDTGHLLDPNRFNENPKYILDLLLKAIAVSIETENIFLSLPKMEFAE